MQQTSHLSRAAHLVLAVLLAIAMCVPLYAYADEPADGSAADAAGQMVSSEESTDAADPQDEAQPEGADEQAPAVQSVSSSMPILLLSLRAR